MYILIEINFVTEKNESIQSYRPFPKQTFRFVKAGNARANSGLWYCGTLHGLEPSLVTPVLLLL